MDDSDPYSILKIAASIKVGRGLVEIIALATLIGSSTASDLILGNKGAAGLVWGSISAFGCSSVIKACASAASTGWLRQMLGLRTGLSDKTFGMDLSLAPKSKVARRMRGMLDTPLGVSCNSNPTQKSPKVEENLTYHDIYAFDNTTSTMLSEVSSTVPNTPLTIRTHYPYASYRAHYLHFQVLALLLSLLKVFEIYTLLILQHGGVLFAMLSSTSFLFSLFAGVCLEIHDIITSPQPVEVDGHLDILAASPLPTTKHHGGPRKVVLGASKNTRTGPWWKFFWIMTGSLQLLSIVMTYFLLGRKSTTFVLTWTGFQLFWVALRMLLFKINITGASHIPPLADRPMKERKLDALPLEMKLRVTNLVLAAASYQTHVHPRKLDAYLDDSFSTSQITRLLAPGNMSEVYTLPRTTNDPLDPLSSSGSISVTTEKATFSSVGRTLNVNILAIIGDTALSSAAWMLGNSKYDYTPMDLYDSCIVVLEVSTPPSPIQEKGTDEPQHRTLAVPSARVFSARSTANVVTSKAQAQEDTLGPLFIPRGAGAQDSAEEKEWIYWIPCDTGEWLQIRSSSFNSNVRSVLGQQAAEVLDDEGVSRMLGAGNLNISLSDAGEVREIVDLSRRASGALLAFLH